MTRYALVEPKVGRVIGWYDHDYSALPEAAHLFELTDEQWDGRMVDPSGWAVKDRKLVRYVPPPEPKAPASDTPTLLSRIEDLERRLKDRDNQS